MKTIETPISDDAEDLAFCCYSAAEYLTRVGASLSRLSAEELRPIEREWRRRFRAEDPAGYDRYQYAVRKRRTAPGRTPDAA